MHLPSRLRFWETKAKATKRDLPKAKSEKDARYFSELEAAGFTTFKKPRSIRVLKFGRCYIDFGWSPSRAKTATKNDSYTESAYIESPPPYQPTAELHGVPRTELSADCERELIQELSAVLVQELPAQVPNMSAGFEQDAIYELESPVDLDFQDFSGDFGEDQFDVTYPALDKWEAPSVQRMVHQALPRLTTQAPSPRLALDEPTSGSPYLLSANDSLTPSPVSPATPNLDTTHRTQSQDWSYVSPISPTASTHQSFSHFMQQYARQYLHDGRSHSEPGSSFTSTPVSGSNYAAPLTGSWGVDSQHNSHFSTTPVTQDHEFAPYHRPNDEPHLPEPPTLSSELSWNEEEFYPATTQHINDTSLWYEAHFDIGSATEDPPVQSFVDPYNTAEPIADTNRSGLNFHTQSDSQQASGGDRARVRTSSSGVRATPYPVEGCQICGKEFTGRYGKGNLSRHIREKHDLVQPLTGKVCRVCDQVYNRADAKRKHEWKKHRLPDARPNKRRKDR